MKVLFLIPPREGFFHTTERYHPIGVLYLAQSCFKNGYDIDILDALTYKNTPFVMDISDLSDIQKLKINKNSIFDYYTHIGTSYDDILIYIRDSNPDIIAMSIMFTCFYDTAYKLADLIKKMYPHITIVAGGAHVSALYNHVLDNFSFDFCLCGEGEITLPKLLNCLSRSTLPYDVEGIAFRDVNNSNGTTDKGVPIYFNDKTTFINNLDDYSLDIESFDYLSCYDTVTLITSRGCPFKCNFCSVQLSMGNRFRTRSIDNILLEIESYYKKGIYNFNIEDDNFSFDMQRAIDLFNKVAEKNININFYLLNGVIASNVTDKAIESFARAGVKQMFFGLETISKSRLTYINKNHTSFETIKKAIFIAQKYSIRAGVSIIIGFPNQKLDDVLAEILTLIKNNILILAINPLYPIPKTSMYYDCIKNNLISLDTNFIELGGDNFPINNSDLTQEDLYYIWVTVRALCKWNSVGCFYTSFDDSNCFDCIKVISDYFNGTVDNSDNQIKIAISLRSIEKEIYSANQKVLLDMISSYIYIRTNQMFYCRYIEDINNKICVIEITQQKSKIPRSIFLLRLGIKRCKGLF